MTKLACPPVAIEIGSRVTGHLAFMSLETGRIKKKLVYNSIILLGGAQKSSRIFAACSGPT